MLLTIALVIIPLALTTAGFAIAISSTRAGRIALAKHSHSKAQRKLRAYNAASNHTWNVTVALAYERKECAAANKLAQLINPNAPLRAW